MTLAHERSMVASHNLVSCAIPFLLPVTFALLFYILNAITMVMPGKVTSRYIPCKNLGDGSAYDFSQGTCSFLPYQNGTILPLTALILVVTRRLVNLTILPAYGTVTCISTLLVETQLLHVRISHVRSQFALLSVFYWKSSRGWPEIFA